MRPSADPSLLGVDRSMVVHDVLEGVTDEQLDPSPLSSCPTLPASRATCISRSRGRSIYRDPAPRAPETYESKDFNQREIIVDSKINIE